MNTPASTIADHHTPVKAATDGSTDGKTEPGTFETTALKEAEALDLMEDVPDYPTGIKLTIITIALSLAVFLVALVSQSRSVPYCSDPGCTRRLITRTKCLVVES